MPDRTSGRTLASLFALYFAQGLPFGFQATALPVYLRASGVSLTGVGLAGALALPWGLKALWAPLVDRYGSDRIGRRKSWILPLQVALAAACALAALVPPGAGLGALLALVLLMNLCAATQDVAVDGLAVDLLRPGELGAANAAQVVGFKTGMLTGGGLLVWASASIGWRGLFGSMAALVLLVALVAASLHEPPAREAAARARASVQSIFGAALRAARAPGAAWLFAAALTYKLGESIADAMFKPFLVDAGVAPATIGLWIGTWGMAASLAGSLGGGWLATRVPLVTAVGVASIARSFAMAGEWALAAGGPPAPHAIILVTLAEHLAGGALTTAMFALLMSRADRSIGATHFTLLASAEVLGKSPGAWLSGALAERIGYAGVFAVGTSLSVAFLAVLAPLRRAASAPAPDEITG